MSRIWLRMSFTRISKYSSKARSKLKCLLSMVPKPQELIKTQNNSSVLIKGWIKWVEILLTGLWSKATIIHNIIVNSSMDPAISYMVVLLLEGITSLWDNSLVWIKRGDWSTRMALIKWRISKRETKCRCSFFWWKKRGSWFSNNRRKTERNPSKFLVSNILRQML